jgi:hypothetical protein
MSGSACDLPLADPATFEYFVAHSHRHNSVEPDEESFICGLLSSISLPICHESQQIL